MKPKRNAGTPTEMVGYVLIAGILLFGLGSAYWVLKAPSNNEIETLPVVQDIPAMVEQAASQPEAQASADVVEKQLEEPVSVKKITEKINSKPTIPSKIKDKPTVVKEATTSKQAKEPKPSKNSEESDLKVEKFSKDSDIGEMSKSITEKIKPPVKASEANPSLVSEKQTEPLKATGKEIKPITAPLLVPTAPAPTVVTVTEEKVWVKLDEKRTVIINKGESAPGLGAYLGTTENGKAKFENKILSVTP